MARRLILTPFRRLSLCESTPFPSACISPQRLTSDTPGAKEKWARNKAVYDKMCSFAPWFQPALLHIQESGDAAQGRLTTFMKRVFCFPPFPFLSSYTHVCYQISVKMKNVRTNNAGLFCRNMESMVAMCLRGPGTLQLIPDPGNNPPRATTFGYCHLETARFCIPMKDLPAFDLNPQQ
jgi:hypothetical protein